MLALGCATATGLTGCAQASDLLDQLVGPRPDATLVELAAQTAEVAPEASAKLVEEISRLCGTHDTGHPPASCDGEAINRALAQDHGQLTPAEIPHALLTAPTPQESRALLTALAIDSLRTTQQPPQQPNQPLGEEHTEIIRTLVQWEHQAIWALDVTRAFADPSQEADIDAQLQQHESALAVLQAALPPNDAPSAAAYTDSSLSLPRGTQPADTAATAEQIRSSSTLAWQRAAVDFASSADAPADWTLWLSSQAALLGAPTPL